MMEKMNGLAGCKRRAKLMILYGLAATGALRLIRDETRIGSFFKDDIGPAPWLIIHQPPPMARPCLVSRHQYFAGVDGKSLAAFGGEFEDAGQGNDVLVMGGSMPVQRGMRRCF